MLEHGQQYADKTTRKPTKPEVDALVNTAEAFIDAIHRGEDRQVFKDLMISIGLKVPRSGASPCRAGKG